MDGVDVSGKYQIMNFVSDTIILFQVKNKYKNN